jgi:hypothetical protein
MAASSPKEIIDQAREPYPVGSNASPASTRELILEIDFTNERQRLFHTLSDSATNRSFVLCRTSRTLCTSTSCEELLLVPLSLSSTAELKDSAASAHKSSLR